MTWIKNIIIYLWSIIRRDKSSKIIFYHDVHSSTEYTDMGTPLSLFQQHIAKIRELNFEIVQQITKEQKQVMICFDDGFRGIWDNRQYFIDNNIMPTVFIAVDLIGKEGYLTIDEIKTLAKVGFRFQAHGWRHSNLTLFGDEELKRELSDAKQKLEELTGLHIVEICFPQGYYSDKVVESAERYGYEAMYTSDPKPYAKRVKENLLPRYLVQHASPRVFKAILNGGMDILYTHYYKLHKR